MGVSAWQSTRATRFDKEYVLEPAQYAQTYSIPDSFEIKNTWSDLRWITFHAPLDNSWVYLHVGVVDSSDKLVDEFFISLSYYYGVLEKGQAWANGSRVETRQMRLSTPGRYFLRVTGQAGAGDSKESNVLKFGHPVSIQIVQGVAARYIWLVASVVAALIAAALLMSAYGNLNVALADNCSLYRIEQPTMSQAAPRARPTVSGAASELHFPQLDGLRAIAVLLVLNYHFLSHGLHSTNGTGRFSVRLFFVLSGFLITGILLRCRPDANPKAASLGWSLQQFYARRFLRIFPLYYFALATAAILNLQEVRNQILWHATYLSNFYYTIIGAWGDGPCSHFWSLAVEEQFYLLWPLLILTLPRRAVMPAIVTAIMFGFLYRVFAIWSGWNMMSWHYLTPANIDVLGVGALLACATSPVFGSPRLRRSLESAGWFLGLPACVILILLMYKYSVSHYIWVLLDAFMALFFMGLVSRAATGFGGIVGSVLMKGPLAFVGRISYGVYVYHLIVMWLLLPHMHAWFPSHPNLALYVIATVVTLLVATMSFYSLERPLNNLKRFFPYAKARQETASLVDVKLRSGAENPA